jgi:sialate O-acetylesterase
MNFNASHAVVRGLSWGMAAVLAATSSVLAEVRLPAVFADQMVLQADAKIPVWGMAAAGEEIQVALADKSAKTKADAEGKWFIELEPLPASTTSQTLVVTGSNRIEIRDVLMGEVWICSGQSNMYFAMDHDEDAPKEITVADPYLRHFFVPEQGAVHPAFTLRGGWKSFGPETGKRFSAVAYYFGKNLRARLNRPVGLVVSSWGGSNIQAWMSIESLQQTPAFTKDVEVYQDFLEHYDENKNSYAQRVQEFERQNKQWSEEVDKPYRAALAAWDARAREAKARGQVEPPKPTISRPAPTRPLSPEGDRGVPSTPFNAMISPLIPYGVKGVLWYQGESNTPQGEDYFELLSRMILDWRKRWGRDDLPVVVVQLPLFRQPAREAVEESHKGNFAWVRDAQFRILKLPQTGLAVALDQGNPADIHPKRKSEVGRRASLVARRLAYSEDIVATGPFYQSMKVEGGKARLTFTSIGAGLSIGPTSGGASPQPGDKLSGFAIAGANKKWFAAEAQIDGDTVVVGSKEVSSPVAVRYGWGSNPPCNLYNKDGLPAAPFRTDDWD